MKRNILFIFCLIKSPHVQHKCCDIGHSKEKSLVNNSLLFEKHFSICVTQVHMCGTCGAHCE